MSIRGAGHTGRISVETHRRHIREKLGLSGNRALLRFAFDHKSER